MVTVVVVVVVVVVLVVVVSMVEFIHAACHSLFRTVVQCTSPHSFRGIIWTKFLLAKDVW